MPTLSVNRRRAVAPIAFALLFGILALAAPQRGAGSVPVECRDVTCSAPVQVSRSTILWVSPEAFYPNNEQVFADLSTDRGSLRLVRSYGADLCKHRFYGQGISALVKACGDVTNVRVRALRLKRGSLPLRITYTATASMDGGAVSPVQGSSFASPELKPISKPLGQ